MKRILDLIAILLPLLLLFMPLFRRIVFGKKRKGVDAVVYLQPGIFRFLQTFIIVLLLLIGIIRYLFYSETGSGNTVYKPEPLPVSKHSSSFNKSLQQVLNGYYSMTDAFAGNDTTAINQHALQLKVALDSFKVDELKKDSSIYLTALEPLANAKVETESITEDPSLDEKRGSLNILSDNLRNLLVIVKYDQAKVYWQECSGAFGEDRPGNWLSQSAVTKNRYPLKNNKDCGGPKDTLNYMPADIIMNKTN
ncbi:MAG TPA: DUF3347 domain-containing protein [Chitinophagaceae bacterium]|nr:DUF3347 domain-containing protein [Chitinophagaceae bacterium]